MDHYKPRSVARKYVKTHSLKTKGSKSERGTVKKYSEFINYFMHNNL